MIRTFSRETPRAARPRIQLDVPAPMGLRYLMTREWAVRTMDGVLFVVVVAIGCALWCLS